MKILTEASGSLTAAYIIKAIRQAGFLAIGSDIRNECFAKYLADDYIVMPSYRDPNLWTFIFEQLKKKEIDLVIPSLDETLIDWAEKVTELQKQGSFVVISDKETVSTFQDKWLTYLFFDKHDIPTPKTSTEQVYKLVKPRFGRGGQGVSLPSKSIDMENMISQEYIKGIEYTVDVLCNKDGEPIYIVPRQRTSIKDGKSIEGIVVEHSTINQWVKKICSLIHFKGPINIQCIETQDKELYFIEINPRIAGGMALGFAATENWIKVIVDHFIYGKQIEPKPIKYGLKMMRYYSEVFTF